MLPPSSSSRFYDRDGITDRIDSFFHPDSGETPFLSLVLHGIGGVGKSHVALKYTHLMAKAQRVKAILWFHSETQTSLEQSFTEAAVALGLPQAGRDRHQENRILLLSWLQQTGNTPIHANKRENIIMLTTWFIETAHSYAVVADIRQCGGPGNYAPILAVCLHSWFYPHHIQKSQLAVSTRPILGLKFPHLMQSRAPSFFSIFCEWMSLPILAAWR